MFTAADPNTNIGHNFMFVIAFCYSFCTIYVCAHSSTGDQALTFFILYMEILFKWS